MINKTESAPRARRSSKTLARMPLIDRVMGGAWSAQSARTRSIPMRVASARSAMRRGSGVREVLARRAEELEHGAREAGTKNDESANAEPHAERDVIDCVHRFVTMLFHASRGTNHVAEEHVRKPAHEPSRVER